jgi:hypothetical protein
MGVGRFAVADAGMANVACLVIATRAVAGDDAQHPAAGEVRVRYAVRDPCPQSLGVFYNCCLREMPEFVGAPTALSTGYSASRPR